MVINKFGVKENSSSVGSKRKKLVDKNQSSAVTTATRKSLRTQLERTQGEGVGSAAHGRALT